MKRLSFILSIALVLCLLGTMVSFASSGTQTEKITYRSISIIVDGKEISPCDVNGDSTEPFIRNIDGSTYLPVRAVAGALGLMVDWDNDTSTVILKSGGASVTGSKAPIKSDKPVEAKLTYRNIVITLDGKAVKLVNAKGEPVEPFIKDGSTYIPVRAVASALGCTIDWNGDTSTVTITSAGGIAPPMESLFNFEEQPKDQTVVKGDDVTLKVVAVEGTEPYTYQWMASETNSTKDSDWKNVTGGTKSSLTIKNCQEELYYKCKVTDAAGRYLISIPVKITIKEIEINPEPIVITGPSDVSVSMGEPSSFKVTVSGGTAPYTYQWMWSSDPNSGFKNLDGRTGSALEFTKSVNTTYYKCVVTDSNGDTATSSIAQLKVEEAAEDLAVTDPEDYSVYQGDAAQMSVKASGGKAPYTYQWMWSFDPNSGFKNLTGQTDSTLEFVKTVNTTYYKCVVTDSNGDTVTSGVAQLYIILQAEILQGDHFYMKPEQLSVSVKGGTEPYSYRWLRSDNKGETWYNTGNQLFLDITLTDTAYFRCLVTDAEGKTFLCEAHVLVPKG